MFCTKCGRLVAETDVFCMGCGNRLKGALNGDVQQANSNEYKELLPQENIAENDSKTVVEEPQQPIIGQATNPNTEVSEEQSQNNFTDPTVCPENSTADITVPTGCGDQNDISADKESTTGLQVNPTNQYENGKVTEIKPEDTFVPDKKTETEKVEFGRGALTFCVIVIALLAIIAGVFAGLYFTTSSKLNAGKNSAIVFDGLNLPQNNIIIETEY